MSVDSLLSMLEMTRCSFIRFQFRFADRVDIVLMLVGTLAAIAFGCGFPVNLIIYGEAIDNFLAKDFGNAL